MTRVHTASPAADRSERHPFRVRMSAVPAGSASVGLRHAPRLSGRGRGRRPLGRSRLSRTARPRPRPSCSTPWSRARPSSATSRSSTSTARAPGRTSRRRWRATSAIGPCSSVQTPAPRSTRVGRTTCRSSCRTCRASSRAARCRSTSSSSTSTPPDAHGFCSLGTSVEAMHAAIRAAKTVVAQLNRGHAADARRELHPCERHRSGGRGRRPALRPRRARPIGDVERRIGEHVAELVPDGATLQLGIGAIPTATALALTDKHDLGHPHRDVHRRRDGPRRGRRRHRRGQGAQPGQDRDDLPDGLASALRVRPRQPDGRDAGSRLHERHPRHPLVQPDGRDQLRDRGRPDRPGRRRLDRPQALLRRRRPDGLHARRGARPGGTVDHRPALDRGPRDGVADRRAISARAPAS